MKIITTERQTGRQKKKGINRSGNSDPKFLNIQIRPGSPPHKHTLCQMQKMVSSMPTDRINWKNKIR